MKTLLVYSLENKCEEDGHKCCRGELDMGLRLCQAYPQYNQRPDKDCQNEQIHEDQQEWVEIEGSKVALGKAFPDLIRIMVHTAGNMLVAVK